MAENSDKKKPEPRRVGQRETLIAGKKYRIRVFLSKGSDGRKRYHSETFHGTAGQAEDRIREIIRRHRAGEAIKANADTLGAFLDEFLTAKKLSIAESTFANYEGLIERHIRPAFGNRLLVAVTAEDIQRLYVKLHNDKMSRASIRDVHTMLGMIFKLAVKRKKLVGSPIAGVEVPREWAAEDDDAERPAMTADQIAKFLKVAEGERFENLFKLAFHLGCRPGEFLALKWEDFDQQAKTLRIDQNIVFRKAGDWYLKKPKSKKGRRTLPLTDAMVALLKAQRTAQLEARMRVGKLWKDHGFVFARSDGEPYSQDHLYNDFTRIVSAANLPAGLSPYTARHSMASLLLSGGTNPKAVQERLGHSRITTTLAAYAHVLPGEQAAVSEEIERLLNGKKMTALRSLTTR
jgi:integrase